MPQRFSVFREACSRNGESGLPSAMPHRRMVFQSPSVFRICGVSGNPFPETAGQCCRVSGILFGVSGFEERTRVDAQGAHGFNCSGNPETNGTISEERTIEIAHSAVSGLPGRVEGLVDSRETCDPTLQSRNAGTQWRLVF